jgi:hopanoid biosynthesis associated RND transporter like protein HpnN
MLARLVLRTIGYSINRAWIVVIISILLTGASIVFAGSHFKLNTDINTLISSDLSWRKRDAEFTKAFPRYNLLLAVVTAPTPELADQAAAVLTQALAKRTDRFHSVTRMPAGEAYFEREGLLFQSPKELAQTTQKLAAAEPLIHDLAADPSLRGLTDGLTDGIMSVQSGKLKLDNLTYPMDRASDTIEDILAGRPASFSWQALAKGQPAEPHELRRLIDTRPILDFAAIEPGQAASDTIRETAAQLNLASKYQATVRLTGPVALNDEEFGTIKENIVLNESLTVLIVLGILWWALRSPKLIFAVFANMFVGLALTAAAGLLMVGTLNLISVYFAVLFVGLGVDFGIQFSVRYREERHVMGELRTALLTTGKHVGAPLTLAAAAVAAGFFSFLPTDYSGVSELGLIAGFGMLIAFFTSITLLPAMLYLLKPADEREPVGFAALAPLDSFMERNRIAIIVITSVVVAAGLPLLYWLRFDFDPMHLRSPKVESVATYLELSKDPNAGVNAIEMLSPSLAAAETAAAKLRQIPQVSRVVTLSSLVPDQQPEKLAMIKSAADKLNPALSPTDVQPTPTDAENVDALKDEAGRLTEIAEGQTGPGAIAAHRLSNNLTKLAAASPEMRTQATAIFITPLKIALRLLSTSLKAEPVTVNSLPPQLVKDWRTPDGRTRVEIMPQSDVNNDKALRDFTRAVLAAEPTATGGPVAILESARTVITAFFQAGGWALLSIAVLLWLTLGRIRDVLLTLGPLLLAGVVTLELCVILDMPRNFANIIALPLLLGVGVAFKIYYIMAWRAGQTNLLQSVLTRAVTFSALATATAFGSLWFSSHPGTSSMGRLLALSLLCTLAAAVLFQPLLMGKPREAAVPAPPAPPTPQPTPPSEPELGSPARAAAVVQSRRGTRPRAAKRERARR